MNEFYQDICMYLYKKNPLRFILVTIALFAVEIYVIIYLLNFMKGFI